jgi:hypothetical protein
MLTPQEVNKALDVLKMNKGVAQMCLEMGWRDLSPLCEAIRLRLVQWDLGRADDLIHAYSIQARNDFSLFPLRDNAERQQQRDRHVRGLVNLTSKCTDDFIIYYAFPITQVVSRK